MPRTMRSRHSYAETVAAVTQAITSAGNTIFAAIDQSAAARAVGLALRPTTLILFGNPKGGTPLMQAFPLVALELPLKILIWEGREAVSVAYLRMSEIAERYGVKGMDERIAAMDGALEKLTAAII